MWKRLVDRAVVDFWDLEELSGDSRAVPRDSTLHFRDHAKYSRLSHDCSTKSPAEHRLCSGLLHELDALMLRMLRMLDYAKL